MPTVISKSQLQFPYSWTAIPPDDARVTGPADGTFLNRNEGYEVLYFLNRVCKDLAQAQKAERLIYKHLPGHIRSRENVLKWLSDNWTLHA